MRKIGKESDLRVYVTGNRNNKRKPVYCTKVVDLPPYKLRYDGMFEELYDDEFEAVVMAVRWAFVGNTSVVFNFDVTKCDWV